MTRLRANDPCWCGSGRKLKRCHGDHESFRRPHVEPGVVSPRRDVPASIARPAYVGGASPANGRPVQILSGSELDRMRHAGRVAAEVLLEVGTAVDVGITTDELDAIAHDAYVRRDAYPSTLGYGTYVKSICSSVNDVVCHGIPDSRRLVDGDIVNLDVTAFVAGMHGDTSATFLVGDVDEATCALVETAAVDDHRNTMVLVPGRCFTVEPMLTAGRPHVAVWDDGWTVVTDDGLPSAQFEHTVVVTVDGAEVVTVDEHGDSAVHGALSRS